MNKLENFDDQFMGEVAIHPQIQVVCFWLGEVDRQNPEYQELYQADKMVDLGFEEGKHRKSTDKNPAIVKIC